MTTTPRINIYDITKDHEVRIIIPLFQDLVIHPTVHRFFTECGYEDNFFATVHQEQFNDLAIVLHMKLKALRDQNDPTADLFAEQVDLWIHTTNDYLSRNDGYLAYYALPEPIGLAVAVTRLHGFEAALRATAHLIT